MEKNYFALIGDIVGSRKLPNRAEVQERFRSVLDDINSNEKDSVAAGFIITLGDEFQGLLYADGGLSPIYAALKIKNALYPVKLRISIGIGGISTEINPQMALGADGEAFYRARDGMNKIRVDEHAQRIARENDGAIRIVSGNDDLDEYINTLLLLTGTIRKHWSERQGEIARRCLDLLITEDMFKQRELADEFGITQGTLSKSLNSSDTLAYLKGVHTAKIMLEKRYR